MFCDVCGAELPDNVSVCTFCGSPVKQVAVNKPIIFGDEDDIVLPAVKREDVIDLKIPDAIPPADVFSAVDGGEPATSQVDGTRFDVGFDDASSQISLNGAHFGTGAPSDAGMTQPLSHDADANDAEVSTSSGAHFAPAGNAAETLSTPVQPTEESPYRAALDEVQPEPEIDDAGLFITDNEYDIGVTELRRPVGTSDADVTGDLRGTDWSSFGSKSDSHDMPVVSEREGRRKSRSGFAIAFLAIFLIAAAGGAFLVFVLPTLAPKVTASATATSNTFDEIVPVEASIPLKVYSPGMNSTGSRIPVRVFGFTLDGNEVDQVDYVDENGNGLKLFSGEYEVQLAGSPINDQGAIYFVPGNSVSVSVDKIGVCVTTQDNPWELYEIPVEETKREDIEQAYQFILTDPEREKYADQLLNKALLRIGINLNEEREAEARAEYEAAQNANNGNSSSSSTSSSNNSGSGSYNNNYNYNYNYNYDYSGSDSSSDDTSSQGTTTSTDTSTDTSSGSGFSEYDYGGGTDQGGSSETGGDYTGGDAGTSDATGGETGGDSTGGDVSGGTETGGGDYSGTETGGGDTGGGSYGGGDTGGGSYGGDTGGGQVSGGGEAAAGGEVATGGESTTV